MTEGPAERRAAEPAPSQAGPPGRAALLRLARALLALALVTALLAHPTQVTVRQWAELAARGLGFGQGLARLVPAAGVCVSDLLFVGAFGLWLLVGLAEGRLAGRLRRYPPAFVALFAAAALSVLPFLKPQGLAGGRAVACGRAARELVQLFILLGCTYAVVADRLRDPAWRRRLAAAFLCAACLAVLVGVWEYGRLRPSAGAGGVIVSPAQVDGTFGFRGQAAGPHEQAGTLSNRNVLGAWASLVVPLLWGMALCVRRPVVRAACGVAAAAGLLLLLHGGLWLFTLLGLLVVAYVRGPRAFAATGLGLFVLWAAVFCFGPQQHGGVLLDSVMLRRSYDRYRVLPLYGGGAVPPSAAPAVLEEGDNGVWQQRYLEWQAGVQAVARSPLFGVGLGNYQARVNRYYEPPPDRLLNPQGVYGVRKPAANLMESGGNAFYLVWLTETGFVGLLAFAWVMLFGLRGAALSYRDAQDDVGRGLALGALGALCAAAGGLAFTNYLVRGVGAAFVFVLACAAQAGGGRAGEASL